jgi:hypothetical protein
MKPVPPPPPARVLRRMPPPPPPPARPLAKKPPPTAVPGAPSTVLSTAASTKAKLAITASALELRAEQLDAHIQYYGADQQTNAELDEITKGVIAELRALKQESSRGDTAPDVEVELIHSLRGLLEKLFSPQRTGFLTRKIQDVQRRITRLFFSSELYAKLADESQEVKSASWPEQALHFALKRHEEAILKELEGLPVADEAVRTQAIERFQGFQRKLCTDFLSKATPELERLLRIYSEELTRFFYKDLPQGLGELCWEVIRESRVARDHRLGYKLTADKFQAFRQTFDKKLLERLVFHVQEPIVKRATESDVRFRDATLSFVSDPRIHSEICAAINDALYDYLHGEGYLDLPTEWRHALTAARDRAE